MFIHRETRINKNSIPPNRGRKGSIGSKPANPLNDILFLHKALGNQAVQRLIESGALRTKLTVGKPNDIYEQEADRVAEQLMRMPETSTKRKGVSEFNESESVQRVCEECEEELQRQTHGSGLGNLEQGRSSKEGLGGQEKGIKIQRICTECEEELNRQPIEVEEKLQTQHMEEEGVLQAKKALGSTLEDTFGIESTVNSQRGSGQPLPQPSEDFFGSRFGADFSGVRVHTDSESDNLNRSLNSRAFTTGQDIFFRRGEYNPGSSSGKALLAHELTHVVQQRGDGVRRKLTINQPGERYEQEAGRITTDLMKGAWKPETNSGKRLLVHELVHVIQQRGGAQTIPDSRKQPIGISATPISAQRSFECVSGRPIREMWRIDVRDEMGELISDVQRMRWRRAYDRAEEIAGSIFLVFDCFEDVEFSSGDDLSIIRTEVTEQVLNPLTAATASIWRKREGSDASTSFILQKLRLARRNSRQFHDVRFSQLEEVFGP